MLKHRRSCPCLLRHLRLPLSCRLPPPLPPLRLLLLLRLWLWWKLCLSL
jgi:hypothetical protein